MFSACFIASIVIQIWAPFMQRVYENAGNLISVLHELFVSSLNSATDYLPIIKTPGCYYIPNEMGQNGININFLQKKSTCQLVARSNILPPC